MSSTSWLVGVSGNWSIGGYWSSGLPNSSSNVTIGAPGVYTVALTSAASVNTLTLDYYDATFNESSSGTLTVANGLHLLSGQAILDGTNQISGGITLTNTDLSFNSAAALGGGSTITATGQASDMLATGNTTLTNTMVVSNADLDIAATTGSTLTLDASFYTVSSGAYLYFGDTYGDNGTVVLTTANGWNLNSGAYVEVQSGTLKAGDGGFFNSLLDTSIDTTVDSAGTIDLNGFNTTINELSGSGIVETSRSGDQPVKLVLVGTSEFDGQIEGRLTLDVAGIVALGGTNTYTGGTIIESNDSLTLVGGSGSITGNVVNNGHLISDVSGTTTLAGNVTGNGDFFQAGPGVTTLTGTNTFSGVRIDYGTVAISQAAALGSDYLTLDGGELLATKSMALNIPLLITGNSGLMDIAATAGKTVTIGATSGWAISGGVLEFGDATTAPVNTGTIVWDTPAGSGSTGQYVVQVDPGTLKAGAQSLTTLLQAASQTYMFGGTIDLGGYATTIGTLQGEGIVQNLSGGTQVLDVLNGQFYGEITGKITLEVTDTLILDNASNYTGNTIISSGGVLALGDGSDNGSIVGTVADSGTLDFVDSDTTDFTGKISGNGVVFQAGAGTTILDYSNTFTGGTTVGDGVLEIYKGAGLGTGELTMQGGELLGSTPAGATSPATITVTNALDMSGVVDFSAGTGDTLKMEGAWNAHSILGTTNAFNFGDGTNDGIVTWYSPSGTNDVANNFTVDVESGTLRAGDGNLSDLLALANSTTVSTGATLDFASFSSAVNNLEGAGTVADSGSAAISVILTGGDFTGTISGNMTLDVYDQVTLEGTNKSVLDNIESSATLTIGGTQKEAVTFLNTAGGSTLVLETGVKFSGALGGFGIGDTIDVQGVTDGAGTSFTYNTTTKVLQLTDGTHTFDIQMAGSYSSGNFLLGPDGSTGTDITFDAGGGGAAKPDSFDFSLPQPAAAPAVQPAPAVMPITDTNEQLSSPVTHTAYSETITDLIQHLLDGHHAPAFTDFAFV